MSAGCAESLIVFCLALNTAAAQAQVYDPEKGSPLPNEKGPR
jgi:hypothetical protein